MEDITQPFQTIGTKPIMEFKWRQPLGDSECPYVIRWVFKCKWFSLRLHHWLSSDDKRHFHDHEWWYLTIILWGSYTEWSPNVPYGRETLKVGSIRYRPAIHKHIVTIPKGGSCWSFLITGPKIRDFGFWVRGKFRKRNKYFFEHGHHPCE